jgi:cobalt-zinc-cadmium efflux system membrane fusion protein
MTQRVRGRTIRWLTAAGAALLLLAIGAAAGVFWSERRGTASLSPSESASPDAAARGGGGHSTHGGTVATKAADGAMRSTDEPVEVSISPEAAKRAGIRVVEVKRGTIGATIAVPGTVASNPYRETKINALLAGVAREVSVELGAEVRRGQPLAVIFSSELADAQMKYLSLRAMLHADNQKLERTRRLTDIGAASRQELEEVTAAATARATEVAAARQRLQLLGLTSAQVERLTDASQIVSELTVTSPLDGVVIARVVNQGQVLQAGQDLFVVADLSSVWVIADLYEKDFPSVRVGTHSVITVAGLPRVRGRVAYIDPRVDAATRTAKIRVEVPNAARTLRLGMFAQVIFEATEGRSSLVVPRQAVQAVGERNVVYVATSEEGRFEERIVRLGDSFEDAVEILDGVRAGERVVTDGSFYLRAEAGRARASG